MNIVTLKRISTSCLFIFILSLPIFSQRVSKPLASVEGGIFTTPITVNLSTTTPNASIFYTTNGQEPDSTNQRYSSPLSINNTTTLRVKAYSQGLKSSNVLTHTYLFNANHTFPIAAVSFKPADFFGDTGIYTQFNAKREVPIHLEFFDSSYHHAAFSMALDTEIQGSASATLPQKSLEIKAGNAGIPYPIFPTLPFQKYQRFVLRNSGQDWGITMFRDAMVQSLGLRINDLNGILDTPKLFLQDYRPTAVYYNGQYWGIHDLRERINRFYVQQHFGWAASEFDMIENWGETINNGDIIAFNKLINSLNTQDFSTTEAHDSLQNMVDVPNFMDYVAFNIIIDNEDWPMNNSRCFRKKINGKWQWVNYDHDFSFGLNTPLGWNTSDASQNALLRMFNKTNFAWPNSPPSTLLFRKCMDNANIRHNFINRSADLLNTLFLPTRVVSRIDEFVNLYTPELPKHVERWGTPTPLIFDNNVEKLRLFAQARPDSVRKHFVQQFPEITGISPITLSVQPQTGGTIKFSTLNLSDKNLPFTGQYFTGIDIPIQALPNNGYRFHHWSDTTLGTNPNRMVNLTAPHSLIAFFVATNDTCSIDSLPPQFTYCPRNIIVKTDSTCANAIWVSPTIVDNCQTPPSVSSTHQSGFCFPIGTTQVVYTAIDVRGNSATCQFSVSIELQNPCLSDLIPPAIDNCPENIIIQTANTCANAYWEEPLFSDNCKSVPSVTRSHQSGFCFNIGTTTVIYSATDARQNTATCRFTVTLLDSTQNTSCKQFTADNTHIICGCSSATYMPYSLYLEQATANCPGILFKNENLILTQTTTSTATLKGRLRSANWMPIELDIRLTGGTRFTTPTLVQCLSNQPISATNGWFYYTQMSGTIKMGSAAPINISLDNTPFQIGKGANMQWTQLNGASARISLSNGQKGWLQFVLKEEKLVSCDVGSDNTSNSVTIRSIYPNPSHQSLSIDTESSGDQTTFFSIYNAFGKAVLAKQHTLSKGRQTIVIDISQLEAGVFYIISEANQGESAPIKFVKL